LAVLLVTPDIDEAVLLGDRILLMEDGRIAVDLPIHLPHPRRCELADCVALRTRLLAELGIDQEGGEAEW